MDGFFYHCARRPDGLDNSDDKNLDAQAITSDIIARAAAVGIEARQADAYLAGARNITQAIGAALLRKGLPQSRLFIQ